MATDFAKAQNEPDLKDLGEWLTGKQGRFYTCSLFFFLWNNIRMYTLPIYFLKYQCNPFYQLFLKSMAFAFHLHPQNLSAYL